MASTAEPAPSTVTVVEEWTNSLGDLIISTSSLEPSTEKLENSIGSYSQSSSIVKLNGTKCVSKTIQTFLFAKNEFRKQFIDGCLQLSKIAIPT